MIFLIYCDDRSTIALLRVVSSSLVYTQVKTLLNPAIFAFITHLSIGDTWNTINNVENRLGTSFVGVMVVWLSLAYTVYQYYLIKPIASFILLPSLIWISIASFLIYSIYKLNYDDYGKPSLFPSKEEGPVAKWKIPFISK